jgi:bacillolysin
VSRRMPRLVVGLVGAAVIATAVSVPGGPAYADRSLRAELVDRAGGHAQLSTVASGGFFGAEAGHAAVRPSDIARTAEPARAAQRWMSHYGRLFGVADPARELRSTATTRLSGGDVAVRLEQLRAGLPVVGGGLVVTLDGDNDLVSVSARTSAGAPANGTEAGIDARTAARIAVRAVGKHVPAARALRAEAPGLAVLDRGLFGAPDATGPVTVWDVAVTSRTEPLRHRVFLEAAHGGLLLDLDANAHAERIVCTPKTARIKDPGCPDSDDVNLVADPAGSTDQDVVDAYRFAGAVDDFYSTYLGRDSLDDHGMTLASTVHYCPPKNRSFPESTPCPNYPNAFWDGAEMVYGDGYTAGLDVVGHELTHGVTEHTSNLLSYYQSGAINESISDVLGELMQQIQGPALSAYGAADAWKLGEDLPGGPFRLLDHPEQDPDGTGPEEPSPNRMTSGLYSALPMWDPFWDQGGVHANAGVGNKTGFLIAAGPNGDGTSAVFNGVTMTGVTGADAVERAVKTANVFYRADQLLVSSSTYRDLAFLLPQACNQLVGDSLATPTGETLLTSDDCVQVAKAVTATELAKAPTKAGAVIPPASPWCTNGGGVTLKRSDLFETNPFAAGSYRRGHTRSSIGDWWWSKTKIAYYGNLSAPLYQRPGSTASLWGDDADPSAFDPQLSSVYYQDSRATTVKGIKAAAGMFVRFEHAWEFDYSPFFDNSGNRISGTKYFDGGRVEYSVDGGSKWYDAATRSAVAGKALFVNGGPNGRISNTDGGGYIGPNPLKGKKGFVGSSHGYTSSRLDLSPLKGRNVLLRWRIGADESVGSYGWYVDNIRAYSCNPTTISLTAPASVQKGHTATLKAHLVRSGTTTALAGKPVQLWQRKHGTTTWNKVGDPKSTGDSGNVTWSPKPTVKTDYRVRFPGQLPLAPSNYAAKTVAVT